MKSIDEEYEEITKEYDKKMKVLKQRANQPMDPLVLAAWKARRRNKLIILWTIYTAIVSGFFYFALWIGDFQWNYAATNVSLGIITAPLSLLAFMLFRQMDKVIKAGAEKWWTILKYGAPLGGKKEIDKVFESLESKPYDSDDWYFFGPGSRQWKEEHDEE